jgi:transaldolase
LARRFPDFRKAYDEGALEREDLDSFGPTLRTLRQFLRATTDLAALVRDEMTPDPDLG